MTQINYKMLFSFEMLHTYFENSICNCLVFVPTIPTLNLLARFGFNLRNKINGFDFYSTTPNSISNLLDYITQVTGENSFDFAIQTMNPQFNNFTDLPDNFLGMLNFDSQSSNNQIDGNIVLLSQNLVSAQNSNKVGMVKFHFDDILKNQNANGLASFEIRLNARSTQWQYYIVNSNSLPLENPSISGKDGITFNGPENVTIQSGQQALFFSSGNNFLPMSEIPVYKFDLVNNPSQNNIDSSKKKTSTKTLFKGLPNPDPANLGIANINGVNKVASPMYVFL